MIRMIGSSRLSNGEAPPNSLHRTPPRNVLAQATTSEHACLGRSGRRVPGAAPVSSNNVMPLIAVSTSHWSRSGERKTS